MASNLGIRNTAFRYPIKSHIVLTAIGLRWRWRLIDDLGYKLGEKGGYKTNTLARRDAIEFKRITREARVSSGV